MRLKPKGGPKAPMHEGLDGRDELAEFDEVEVETPDEGEEIDDHDELDESNKVAAEELKLMPFEPDGSPPSAATRVGDAHEDLEVKIHRGGR